MRDSSHVRFCFASSFNCPGHPKKDLLSDVAKLVHEGLGFSQVEQNGGHVKEGPRCVNHAILGDNLKKHCSLNRYLGMNKYHFGDFAPKKHVDILQP